MMKNNHIEPFVLTYNTLINKAENYDEGLKVLKTMKDNDIKPNKITFNSLINKAEGYDEGLRGIKNMEDHGIEDFDLSALRIAEARYRIVQNRLLKLAQIKKFGHKFASVGDIDLLMANIQKEYDEFFISLFS